MDNARAKNVFVLAVSLTIKPGTLGLFKERWGVLAEHCRSGAEPNCLSYELCVKEGTEESAAGVELLIYERYVSKADLEGTHNASAPFKAFGCVARGAPRVSERAPPCSHSTPHNRARRPQEVAERGERDRARKKQGHLH